MLELFADKRTQFDGYGYMQVVTEKPFYEPGDNVKGNVFMEVANDLDCPEIEFEIKGGQKLAFTRFWHEMEGDDEEQHMVEKHERMKDSDKFMHWKADIYKPEDGVLKKGQYQISFEFELPKGMPSSIQLKDDHKHEKPKCKVKYFVKCKVNDDFKYKSVLIIREEPVKYKEGKGIEETCDIKCFCCFPQGPSTLKATFEKNTYTPEEDAKCHVKVDNSECKAKCDEVEFAVEQKMSFKIGGHTYHYSKDLVRDREDGPDAGEGGWEKNMEVDLGKIKNKVKTHKTKKGKMKEVSPEDLWQQQGVQPACHSPQLKNEYFLTVEAKYSPCVCCINLPDAKMPFSIIPSHNPDLFGFTMPDGFEPQKIAHFDKELKCKW